MRTAVVGLRMGRGHAEVCAKSARYDLVAVCDLDKPLLTKTARELGIECAYTDYVQMLFEMNPDVVVIATPTSLHLTMIRQAIQASVRGIYCEKPIAGNMGEVREIDRLCKGHGVRLVIGHQRRVSDPYRTMKRLIDAGEIGELRLIKATCAGDLLTDGTHLIDSALYLFHDVTPEWVLGQVYRGRKATEEELRANPFAYHGTRYGHLVEEGAVAVIGMPGDARIEVMTGGVWQPDDGYQHLEVVGTKGRILRSADGADPAVLIERGQGWEAVECDGKDDGLEAAHALAAEFFAGEIAKHPMDIDHAIMGFRTLNAIFESARTHAKIVFPCAMDDDPLARMLEDGEMR